MSSEEESLADRIQQWVDQVKQPFVTYRVQCHAGFSFTEACKWLDYWEALGVSDLYLSPIQQARPGSAHGYDVSDFQRINSSLGGIPGWNAIVRGLQEKGMGVLLDIVPNHMGIADSGNRHWRNVLELGGSSPYLEWFDVDWESSGNPNWSGKVMLPILGEPFGKALVQGNFRIIFEQGSFWLRYYEHKLPLFFGSYVPLLGDVLSELQQLGDSQPAHALTLEIQEIKDRLEEHVHRIPHTDRMGLAKEWEDLKRRLGEIYKKHPKFQTFLGQVLTKINGSNQDESSFDALEAVLRLQTYRLAYWRLGKQELNYRRFFEVNDLIGVQVDREEVFQATHQLVFQLINEGALKGLRVDHPDGLLDPAEYFTRLQKEILQRGIIKQVSEDVAGLDQEIDRWFLQHFNLRHNGSSKRVNWPIYVVAEKILASNESLPGNWPVSGSTGYDFLVQVNGLFVDSGQEASFTKIYERFTGQTQSYSEVAKESKEWVIDHSFQSELHRVVQGLRKCASRTRAGSDYSESELRQAVRAWLVAFPLYRTYVAPHQRVLSTRERNAVDRACQMAILQNPLIPGELLTFVKDLLWPKVVDNLDADFLSQTLAVVQKFQQLSSAIMAKGVEDTAFYRYVRLVSLNEVGGHPNLFGNSVDQFHLQNLHRVSSWPFTLLCTSTHDTKRGEDARARINVLSELVEDWETKLNHWSEMNEKTAVEKIGPAPDALDEYFIYQTLLGVWPVTLEEGAKSTKNLITRVKNYLVKALREAKRHTTWEDPNENYESAVLTFMEAILDPNPENEFFFDFLSFQKRISFFGRWNSFSQTTLKFTVPGIPDVYQGSEFWDFSLVDPDNRRPIPFSALQTRLSSLTAQLESPALRLGAVKEALLEGHDGKLLLVRELAHLRKTYSRLFLDGDYLALEVVGEAHSHVFAFARVHGESVLLVLVPRLVATLTRGIEAPPLGTAVWGNTRILIPSEIGQKDFMHVLTHETISVSVSQHEVSLLVGEVFKNVPLGLLI